MGTLIDMQGISKFYRAGESTVTALHEIGLQICAGEWVAIVGRSGSGKSTLMNILGCLDTPSSGVYRLAGEDVGALSDRRLSEIRNRQIGFVFQGFNLIPGLTALENVELPLLYRTAGERRGALRARAAEALEQVGLGERLHHRPGQLSGGQQQRVAIARAIAADPPLILADEPTGNLDSASGEEVVSILQRLWRAGRTVVLITHDPSLAARAGRVLTISDGRLQSA